MAEKEPTADPYPRSGSGDDVPQRTPQRKGGSLSPPSIMDNERDGE
jgi:hypothetical protein